MSARRLVVGLLLLAGCSNGACAAFFGRGGGGPSCCESTPVVRRNVEYAGTIAAGDGGVPTQVRMTVSNTNNVRLTFERDGVRVVESFQAR